MRWLSGFFMIFLLSSVSAAENQLQHFTKNATDWVLESSGLPSISSSNSTKKLTGEQPSAELKAVFDRVNSGLFGQRAGFGIGIVVAGNILSDSERKLILVDTHLLYSLWGSDPFQHAALFAHELAHYIHIVYSARNSLPLEVTADIPPGDHEHAYVELFACEIMRRAGFSDEEIRRAFAGLHGPIELFLKEITPKSPSTDVRSRRAMVNRWLE